MMAFFNPYFKSRNNGNDKPPKQSMSFAKQHKNKESTFLSITPECIIKPKSSKLLKKYNGEQPRLFYRGEPVLLCTVRELGQWPVKDIVKVNDGSVDGSECETVVSSTSYGETDSPVTTNSCEEIVVFHIYEQCVFCAHDVSYEYLPWRYKRFLSPTGAIISLIGKTEDGTDVCVNVHGQAYYFYVAMKDEAATRDAVSKVMSNLEKESSSCSYVVKPVNKMSLMGFNTNTSPYLMMSFSNHFVGKEAARNLKDLDFEIFEHLVEPNTRFLVDNEFCSFGWYSLKTPYVRQTSKDSNCELELDCCVGDLQVLRDRVEWPNYKCMAFDIECLSGSVDDAFPDATNPDDIIIQISCVCFDIKNTIETQHLFTLGSCAEIPGVYIYECASEYELIESFLTFVRVYGPNFITGYNINAFDIPYVIGRCRYYNIQCGAFTKMKRGRMTCFKGMESFLNRCQCKVTISGIVIIDMYRVCMDKVSAPNHKLDTVVDMLLGEKKHSVPYKQIPVLFRRDDDGRAVVGAYCVHDSVLVHKLFCKLLFHYEASAIARLSNISMNKVIFDGQQSRIFTCMLAAARREGLIIPSIDEAGEDTYQGATVLEPKTGFYNTPVAVFDFASLYPSIIQAYNLCYCTLITDNDVASLREEDVTMVTTNTGRVHRFVKPHVRKSILSQLLTSWLAERKAVREKLKHCKDPLMQILLDKQQLALKLTCNAVYGFTGVSKGMFPCLAIAESVTAQGRQLLAVTKQYICDRFNDWTFLTQIAPELVDCPVDSNRFKIDVVYGDTDSVFVLLCGIEDADRLYSALPNFVAHITKTLFPPPIKLEVDKVFEKLLLLCKKRYVGVLHGEEKLSMKGIDLVRRNVCGFVKNTTLAVIKSLFSDNVISEAVQKMSGMTQDQVCKEGLPPGFFKLVALITDARERLYENRVDIHELQLSATLTQACDKYKQQNLPHLTVVRKKLERREEIPNTGDRIFYVLLAHPDERVANYVIAEDPDYVETHNLQINCSKYFSNLISSITHSISPIFPEFISKPDRFLMSCVPRKTYPKPILN
uniref:DNA polymerase n=1 Tax=Elephant endotheliotropic herpesvirus 1A TaxID=759753 RepID=G3FDT9_ELHV1|nr:U38 [Elephant endotheliotropic herpesvirus 1A]